MSCLALKDDRKAYCRYKIRQQIQVVLPQRSLRPDSPVRVDTPFHQHRLLPVVNAYA